jgi:DNA replication protein DnaC
VAKLIQLRRKDPQVRYRRRRKHLAARETKSAQEDGKVDQTLPRQVRYYARFDLLIIDEFGSDRIERAEAPQAASLLYKVVDARSEQRSTALVTNLDFEAWAEYLGDPPLAMALLDRIVDGAIILKIAGKSYRAHRAKPGQADTSPTK